MEREVLYAALSALISLFLEFCFRPRNIFSFWLDWWAVFWLKRNDPGFYEAYRDLEELPSGFDSWSEYLRDRVDWFWFPPLGNCVVCFNVWVSFAVLPFYTLQVNGHDIFSVQTIFGSFVVVLLSSFLVRYFHSRLL